MLLPDYLARLGLAHMQGEPPSAAALQQLHRAHVATVAYETVDLVLGRPPALDGRASAQRIAAGRGGYCYTLHGAFGWLLEQLGYDVRRHLAGVARAGDEPMGADGNHLGLTVSGLPAVSCPDGVWLVDVALGDALREPLPLRWGVYRQGPFEYRLGPSPLEPGGWRFEQAAGGSFSVADFAPGVVGLDAFAEQHRYLSSDPASPYVRTVTAQRRDATGVDILRGRVLTRWEGGPPSGREVDEPQWWKLLTGRFGLRLDAADRAPLWANVSARHAEWLAARAR